MPASESSCHFRTLSRLFNWLIPMSHGPTIHDQLPAHEAAAFALLQLNPVQAEALKKHHNAARTGSSTHCSTDMTSVQQLTSATDLQRAIQVTHMKVLEAQQRVVQNQQFMLQMQERVRLNNEAHHMRSMVEQELMFDERMLTSQPPLGTDGMSRIRTQFQQPGGFVAHLLAKHHPVQYPLGQRC